ncbi:dihydrolipoyl dehydrogenase [Salinicola peritrichatus]|uniref:dihydrolipoyl dehydrogenase n=1 Tax=Salinicola peritrichatus TaxID=1267424 RepID=UPI000DA1A8D8|nr:dihydrolipoyl dehydrogenase [Salinicola peritrichatus]
MQECNVDVAIIGAGSAGLSAYRAAKKHTPSVLLIEGGDYGTTCARTGCMPSKVLISAAKAIHDARHVGPFGAHIDHGVIIDRHAVMQRIRDERDAFIATILDSIKGFPAADKLRGQARIEDANSLIISGHTRVRFSRAIIATGSSPHIPEPLQGAGKRILTSDTLFDLAALPESVAVFGPGIVGLELGQALARLDVRVRMFGRSGGVGGLQDEALRSAAVCLFNEEFYLDPEAETHDIQGDDAGVSVTFTERDSGERLTERFDYLLAATGRRPNLSELALKNVGIETDDKGTPIFDRHTLQCHDSRSRPNHIFIVGDADHAEPLLHEATDEGRIAGDNAGRFPDLRAGYRRVPLTIVFCEPQIASVGRNRPEIEKTHVLGQDYAIGELNFENQGRARVMRQNRGWLHLYGEYGTGLFLGAELVAPQAEHLGHLLAWACQQCMTVRQMLDMPFYHPTLEEGVRTALRDLGAKLLLEPAMVDQCTECGPGA